VSRRFRVAVGVMVYNEARNLERLLDAVRTARGPHLDVRHIIVVSSGSTDHSVPIARRHQLEDARVHVIDDVERRGKATAINQFLDALTPDVEVCVMLGGDVLPAPDAVDHLVAAFEDPTVGVAGAHPVPTNTSTSLVSRVVKLQWALHDVIARDRPKMGELIAFRADVPHLDSTTAVDEAWLESVSLGRGQRLAYAPAAIVYNKGPEHLADLVAQRRRIYAGHFILERQTGYRVSTMAVRDLLRPAATYLLAHPGEVPVAAAAGAIELWARALGVWDVLVRKRNPTVWTPIESSKDLGDVP
jgi:cellulose synthase/poly-beta-1,6-N-acetylglucosamine synthase-like glycosyltransferase